MQTLHRTSYFDVEQGAHPEHKDTDPERSSEILRNQRLADNFAIDQKSLGGIRDANNIEFLHQYRGVDGIASDLKSNLDDGIKGDDQDIQLRHEVFGSNQFDDPEAATKTYFKLAFESAKETTTILLLCYATLSLLLGVLKYGVVAGWCDGAMMFFVLFVSFFVRLYKERTHRRTSTIAMKNLAVVDVMREGQFRQILSSQVTVGEIVILKAGDRVPADGLFVRGGSSFKLDDVEETLGIDYYYHFPVIHAGSEVVIGDCRMLVISVGKNTRWSKTMSTSYSHRESPMLVEADKLSANMEKIVLGLLLVFLVVRLLCYLSKKNHGGYGRKQNEGESKSTVNTSLKEILNEAVIIIKKNSGVFNRLIAILGVVLMGVREGLNLGIFITFMYSKRKLKFDHQAIVTNLPACAKIGLVATIFTSETDDLALKQASMEEEDDLGVAAEKEEDDKEEEEKDDDDQVVMDEEEHQEGGAQAAAAEEDDDQGVAAAKEEDDEEEEEEHQEGGAPAAAAEEEDDQGVTAAKEEEEEEKDDDDQVVMDEEEGAAAEAYDEAAADDEPSKVIKEEEEEEEEEEPQKFIKEKITSLDLVGLKNPYPEEIKLAVKACQDAGVNITLILGHDKNTARFMGINSGILNPSDDISKAVVEASEIRNIPENDLYRSRSVSDIRVLANSSPSDKLLLLQSNKRQPGKLVAVTGRNTRDSPAFNEADVGFWIGDGSAKAAEERSDIIMLDRSFASIAAVLRRGRFIPYNMQKFIQLHLTVNIVGFAVNFIAAIPSGNTPLSAIQLLWVGLITDTLGSFALSTDPETIPGTAALPPVNSSLTSKAMWRNVLVQVLYQTIILLMLHFKGKVIFHVDDQAVMDTMVFNTYVVCQIFGLLNAKQIERSGSGEFFSGKNFSEKIYRNRLFVGTAVAIVVLHMAATEIIMVLISHNNKMRRLLDYRRWLFSTGVAALSLPIGYVAKGIPVS